MRSRRLLATGGVLFLVLVAATIAWRASAPAQSRESSREAERRASSADLDADTGTAQRLDALAQAKANDKFGGKVAATTSPTTGWVGSGVLSTYDDWEPAVAT